MSPELLALWANYWRTGLRADRDLLFVSYAPLVKRIAAHMAAGTPPNVEADDLQSVGVLGLIEAVERYNPNRSVSFEAYATRHIKASMVDYLRANGWAPRSVRSNELLTKAQFDQMWAPKMWGLPTELSDPTPGPEALFEAKETAAVVAAARRSLNAQQQQVVRLCFDEGMTLAAIAKLMGLTQGRVSQIRTEALRQLGIHAHAARERRQAQSNPNPVAKSRNVGDSGIRRPL